MRINTNINSMRTQEYMRQNQAKMSNAMDRLSSGKRINNASDDAAGLAIATRMRARESGLGVAANNTQDGMSLIRTADSAMNSVSNILLRMRDLANQSANGTNTDKNQAALDKEFTALKGQIDYISKNTEFNDQKLLDGSKGSIAIQTLDNADTSKQINIDLANTSTNSLQIDTISIEGKGNQTIAITTADIAKDTNIAAVGTAKAALAGLAATATAPEITKAVDDFKAAFDKVDKNLMSDAAIKGITDAIAAYETTPSRTTAQAIGTAYTAPTAGNITKSTPKRF